MSIQNSETSSATYEFGSFATTGRRAEHADFTVLWTVTMEKLLRRNLKCSHGRYLNHGHPLPPDCRFSWDQSVSVSSKVRFTASSLINSSLYCGVWMKTLCLIQNSCRVNQKIDTYRERSSIGDVHSRRSRTWSGSWSSGAFLCQPGPM
jgi:hypothetical protein